MEDLLGCPGEKALVPYNPSQTGSLVEKFCGPKVQTYFDGVEGNGDPHFPEDSDEEVDEFFVEF